MPQNSHWGISVALSVSTYGPDHDILVIIAYVQIPYKRQHADISSEARGFKF